MVTLDGKGKIIFDELNKNNINYSLFRESIPLPKISFFETLFKFCRYPLKTIKKAIRLINMPKVKISPKYIFYSGSQSYEWCRKYSSVSRLISVPTMDYNRFIINKKNNIA